MIAPAELCPFCFMFAVVSCFPCFLPERKCPFFRTPSDSAIPQIRYKYKYPRYRWIDEVVAVIIVVVIVVDDDAVAAVDDNAVAVVVLSAAAGAAVAAPAALGCFLLQIV